MVGMPRISCFFRGAEPYIDNGLRGLVMLRNMVIMLTTVEGIN